MKLLSILFAIRLPHGLSLILPISLSEMILSHSPPKPLNRWAPKFSLSLVNVNITMSFSQLSPQTDVLDVYLNTVRGISVNTYSELFKNCLWSHYDNTGRLVWCPTRKWSLWIGSVVFSSQDKDCGFNHFEIINCQDWWPSTSQPKKKKSKPSAAVHWAWRATPLTSQSVYKVQQMGKQ